ncbi:hypothetical protein KZZ52_46405 [Dactylosporangium sp. AC04546]|nr:hypothetical protein [Dactylosporangium sp. AC04546]WVK81347.1 hypothetical protein KZZ52_46405 [Dactylosporangium sp. AC04546]
MRPDHDEPTEPLDAGDGRGEASGAGVLVAIGVIGILVIIGFVFSVVSR